MAASANFNPAPTPGSSAPAPAPPGENSSSSVYLLKDVEIRFISRGSTTRSELMRGQKLFFGDSIQLQVDVPEQGPMTSAVIASIDDYVTEIKARTNDEVDDGFLFLNVLKKPDKGDYVFLASFNFPNEFLKKMASLLLGLPFPFLELRGTIRSADASILRPDRYACSKRIQLIPELTSPQHYLMFRIPRTGMIPPGQEMDLCLTVYLLVGAEDDFGFKEPNQADADDVDFERELVGFAVPAKIQKISSDSDDK